VAKKHQEKVLKLARKLGVLRPCDLKSSGVPRRRGFLSRLPAFLGHF
jgi:hypothetical protein